MYTNVFRGCNIKNPKLEGFTGVKGNTTKTENYIYAYCFRLFFRGEAIYKLHSNGCTGIKSNKPLHMNEYHK